LLSIIVTNKSVGNRIVITKNFRNIKTCWY